MNFKVNLSALAFTFLLVFVCAYSIDVGLGRQNANAFVLNLRSDKERYLPGEIISLHFEIVNRSHAPVELKAQPTVWDGNIKVFIATEHGDFKEYVGPQWGTRDRVRTAPRVVRAGESIETDATILWNQKAETSHLSEMYAKTISQNRVETSYALPNAGTYYIKAVFFSPETGTSIESSPATVVVQDVGGRNLDVWKVLKRDHRFALFMQTGELFETPNGPDTLKVVSDLQRLLLRHPETGYGNQIRRSLAKHNEQVEELNRQE